MVMQPNFWRVDPFSHIFHEANWCLDNLIKLGVVYEDHSMVLPAPPQEILPLLLVDFISVSYYQQHKVFTL